MPILIIFFLNCFNSTSVWHFVGYSIDTVCISIRNKDRDPTRDIYSLQKSAKDNNNNNNTSNIALFLRILFASERFVLNIFPMIIVVSTTKMIVKT